ncbi:MAG: HAD family hydrolase [Candidatus Omnitrophota bacterium]
MKRKRMIFLDRDGVINKNPIRYDYIKKAAEFKLLPGVTEAVKMLTEAGFDIVVTSNQAGVAKGLFSRDDLKGITEKMIKGIEAKGGKIRKAFYCLHHPDAGCACRKPKAGLIKKAVGKSRIDKKNSFFIGDTERDVAAGKSYGVRTIAVLSGYYNRKDMKLWQTQPDYTCRDLLCAVKDVILKNSI